MRTARRGVSQITATLMLIIITVTMGAIVYTWASNVFNGVDSEFNVIDGQGAYISQNVVLVHANWYPNGTDMIYLTNNGAGPATITNIEVENESAGAQIAVAFTTLPITIQASTGASVSFFMPAHDNTVYYVTAVTSIDAVFQGVFQKPCPLSTSGVYECGGS